MASVLRVLKARETLVAAELTLQRLAQARETVAEVLGRRRQTAVRKPVYAAGVSRMGTAIVP